MPSRCVSHLTSSEGITHDIKEQGCDPESHKSVLLPLPDCLFVAEMRAVLQFLIVLFTITAAVDAYAVPAGKYPPL